MYFRGARGLRQVVREYLPSSPVCRMPYATGANHGEVGSASQVRARYPWNLAIGSVAWGPQVATREGGRVAYGGFAAPGSLWSGKGGAGGALGLGFAETWGCGEGGELRSAGWARGKEKADSAELSDSSAEG